MVGDAYRLRRSQRGLEASGGLLVLGLPGTGKSHLCKQIVSKLRGEGKHVEVLSKTHVASQRVGGVTCDQFIRRRRLRGNAKQFE